MLPRHTARAIVIHNDHILLMERWREGEHYFSIPGGGIENGETAEQTVLRELQEETSIIATVDRQVFELWLGENRNTIFLCTYVSGEPALPKDSEEAIRSHAGNSFLPRWVPLSEFKDLHFAVWQPLQAPIQAGIEHGFTTQSTVVQVEPKR
jgi:8-oxo-dGTP diphosphatase